MSSLTNSNEYMFLSQQTGIRIPEKNPGNILDKIQLTLYWSKKPFVRI